MRAEAAQTLDLSTFLQGKRGRTQPYMNVSLSILPTCTDQWQQDKTLYYQPVSSLSSLAPHQFSKTLREVGWTRVRLSSLWWTFGR